MPDTAPRRFLSTPRIPSFGGRFDSTTSYMTMRERTGDFNHEAVPDGETVLVTDNATVKMSFTRVSRDLGEVTYYAPGTDRQVLKSTSNIYTGTSNLGAIDASFWTVTQNGVRLSPGTSFNVHGDVQIDPAARTIRMTTS